MTKRKLLAVCMTLALLLSLLPMGMVASASDLNMEDFFTDDIFRAAVLTAAEEAYGGTLPTLMNTDILELITELDVSGLGIEDLSGVVLLQGLKWLDCSNNELEGTLAVLPSGLEYLDCSGNEITTIDNLPGALQYFYCSDNKFAPLPILPGPGGGNNGLIVLDCSRNGLSVLPVLPGTLEELYCSGNELTSLPGLPGPGGDYNGLVVLDCSNNGDLPLPGALPGSLEELYCAGNGLTELPTLTNLTVLDCSGNDITELPELPEGLTELKLSGNPLVKLPELPAGLSLDDIDLGDLTFKVVFISNGGSSVDSQRLLPGAKAARPKDPVLSGYGFDYWTLDGERYNFNTPVMGNIVLHAVWLRNTASEFYNIPQQPPVIPSVTAPPAVIVPSGTLPPVITSIPRTNSTVPVGLCIALTMTALLLLAARKKENA